VSSWSSTKTPAVKSRSESSKFTADVGGRGDGDSEGLAALQLTYDFHYAPDCNELVRTQRESGDDVIPTI